MFLSCHVCISEWVHTLYLPECQGTPCSKQARYLKFKWLQRDSNPQPLSSKMNTQPVWPSGWVFVYKLSGCVFKSCCSHLIFNLYMKFISLLMLILLLKHAGFFWIWVWHPGLIYKFRSFGIQGSLLKSFGP